MRIPDINAVEIMVNADTEVFDNKFRYYIDRIEDVWNFPGSYVAEVADAGNKRTVSLDIKISSTNQDTFFPIGWYTIIITVTGPITDYYAKYKITNLDEYIQLK